MYENENVIWLGAICSRQEFQVFQEDFHICGIISDFKSKVYTDETINSLCCGDAARPKLIIGQDLWNDNEIRAYIEGQGFSFLQDYIYSWMLVGDESQDYGSGIDFLKVYEFINNQKLFEHYIEMLGKEIVAIHGNCQTHAVSRFIATNKEFRKKYVLFRMPRLWVKPEIYKYKTISDLKLYQYINIFITQHISPDNRFGICVSDSYIKGQLNKQCKVVYLTKLYFTGYQPQSELEMCKGIDTATIEYLGGIESPNVFGDNTLRYDYNIVELLQKGYNEEKIVYELSQENYYDEAELELFIQKKIEELEQKEKDCDIRMADFIQKFCRTTLLFVTMNHPTAYTIRELADRCLRALMIKDTTMTFYEQEIPLPLPPKLRYVLYPAVIKKFYNKSHYKKQLYWMQGRWIPYLSVLKGINEQLDLLIDRFSGIAGDESLGWLRGVGVKERDWSGNAGIYLDFESYLRVSVRIISVLLDKMNCLANKKNILIWGTGKQAEHMLINGVGGHVIGFIETKKTVETFKGKPVYESKEVETLDYDGIIVANRFADEVYCTCRQQNIDIHKVVFPYPLRLRLGFYNRENVREILGEKNFIEFCSEFQMLEDTFIWEDLQEYNRLNSRKSLEASVSQMKPVVTDRYSKKDRDDCFLRDLWAAKLVVRSDITQHVDIGLDANGFIGHLLAAGVKVWGVSLKELAFEDENLHIIKDDMITLTQIPDESIESMSALGSVECLGLGRYGEEIAPEAFYNCFLQMQKKVKPGGMIYVSVPIGYERVEFNSHRIFRADTVIKIFSSMKLREYSCISDGRIEFHVDLHQYDYDYNKTRFGLFCFAKPL